jgi:hypothetical protein
LGALLIFAGDSSSLSLKGGAVESNQPSLDSSTWSLCGAASEGELLVAFFQKYSAGLDFFMRDDVWRSPTLNMDE